MIQRQQIFYTYPNPTVALKLCTWEETWKMRYLELKKEKKKTLSLSILFSSFRFLGCK